MKAWARDTLNSCVSDILWSPVFRNVPGPSGNPTNIHEVEIEKKQKYVNKQTKTTKQQFRGITGFHMQEKEKSQESTAANEAACDAISNSHESGGQNKAAIMQRWGRLPPTHPLQAGDSNKKENEPKIWPTRERGSSVHSPCFCKFASSVKKNKQIPR